MDQLDTLDWAAMLNPQPAAVIPRRVAVDWPATAQNGRRVLFALVILITSAGFGASLEDASGKQLATPIPRQCLGTGRRGTQPDDQVG